MPVMIRKKAGFLAVCAAVAALSMPAFAQRSVAGTWRVDFVTPLGQTFVNMTINQTGAKLTGHATDEFGEFPSRASPTIR